jgi:hypothetical protein
MLMLIIWYTTANSSCISREQQHHSAHLCVVLSIPESNESDSHIATDASLKQHCTHSLEQTNKQHTCHTIQNSSRQKQQCTVAAVNVKHALPHSTFLQSCLRVYVYVYVQRCFAVCVKVYTLEQRHAVQQLAQQSVVQHSLCSPGCYSVTARHRITHAQLQHCCYGYR